MSSASASFVPVSLRRVLVVLLGSTLAAGLAGCAVGGGNTASSTTGSGVLPAVKTLGGTVYGGSQPISGATVQLVAVGQTGYGSSGAVVATTTTSAAGTWSLTGTYSCPASTSALPYTLVYLTATGGNPGLASGTNGQISLMAALGSCQALVATPPTIAINEATTVASVYALAQFMSATGTIGSYGSSTTGIVNAFATVNNLVNVNTGAMLSTTPAGNGVVPAAELNTLANILATCVNSPGGAAGSATPCGSLLTDATPSGGTAPLNTLQAVLDIALHPGQNVGSLYGLVSTGGPFQPTLPTAPNDWTVALAYGFQGYAANSQSQQGIAIDAGGNVWTVDNQQVGPNSGTTGVGLLSPTGSNLGVSPANNGGDAVAIDLMGNAWVVNTAGSTLSGYNYQPTNGGVVSFAGPFTSSQGLSAPKSLAIDANNNLWIANSGNNSVSKVAITSTGEQFLSGNSGYTLGGLNAPNRIAVDSFGNAYVANASSITQLFPNGVPMAGSPFAVTTQASSALVSTGAAGGYIIAPQASSGNITVFRTPGDPGNALVDHISPAGATGTQAIAIDGSQNVWIANTSSNSLSVAVSPNASANQGSAVNPNGYKGGNVNDPTGIAIDGSGNVWVSNGVPTVTGSLVTSISEFVGAAVPLVTPTAGELSAETYLQSPGVPSYTYPISSQLPFYTPGVSYQTQLVAATGLGGSFMLTEAQATAGNTGVYTWSLAAGSAPLPSGFTLSPSGLISGTTNVTTSTTISVQATQISSQSIAISGPVTLTPTTGIAPLGNEAALNGSYAMLMETFHNNVQTGLTAGGSIIASVAFNGSGTVTGELDHNDRNGTSSQNATFTGSYTYGANNLGTLVLVPNVSGTSPIVFAFAGTGLSGATPQTLRLIQLDDTLAQGTASSGQMGSGVARLQTSASFAPPTLNQSFVFGMQGETPCVLINGNGCTNATVSPFGPLSMVGKFTGNGAGTITFGEEDGAGVNTNYAAITMTGTYTNPDSSGRGTITFAYTGSNVPLAPTHYVYYLVNSGEMLLLSSDGHANFSLLSGDALVQNTTFTTSTLAGNYIGWETAGYNGDGISTYPIESGGQLFVVSVSSPGSLTVFNDQNSSGNVSLEQTQGTDPFSIDANGRIASGNVTLYAASSSRLFGTVQPGATGGGGPGLITLQQQTGSGFSCADLNGNIGAGTIASVVDMPTSTTEYVFTAGKASATQDFSQFGTIREGNPFTSYCSTDSLTSSLGRFEFYDTYYQRLQAVYTITQGQKYVALDLSDTPTPAVMILEK